MSEELKSNSTTDIKIVLPEELTKLTQERDQLKLEKVETETKLTNVVNELIELRKKKSISPEDVDKVEKEKAALIEEVSKLNKELGEIKSIKKDEALNSMASTSTTTATPTVSETNTLLPEQEKLRQEKGWTVEKYLQMKAKYPRIVL